ncbi:hypothetical protein N0V90_004791 [Kalmusia sp. IMI 367209]|nr:hypothetical protein N0V90_004791 [Kalmusia sp. IMI 367209]
MNENLSLDMIDYNKTAFVHKDLQYSEKELVASIIEEQSWFDGRYPGHLEIRFQDHKVHPKVGKLGTKFTSAVLWCTHPSFDDANDGKREVMRGHFSRTVEDALVDLKDAVTKNCATEKEQIDDTLHKLTEWAKGLQSYQEYLKENGKTSTEDPIEVAIDAIEDPDRDVHYYLVLARTTKDERTAFLSGDKYAISPMEAIRYFFEHLESLKRYAEASAVFKAEVDNHQRLLQWHN